MVKSTFNHTIIASDVVNQRTVSVSDKPHLGAELFPLYEPRQDVFPDMENLSFERSIYKRLHGLKLRDSDATGSNLHVLERHWNEESGREIALALHREIAKGVLRSQSFQSNLSAIELPLSRSCLLEKLHSAVNQAKLKRTSDCSEFQTNEGKRRCMNSRTSMKDLNDVGQNHGDLDLSQFVSDRDQDIYEFENVWNSHAQVINERVQDILEFENIVNLDKHRKDLHGLPLSSLVLILNQDANGSHAKGSTDMGNLDYILEADRVKISVGSQFRKKYALRFGTAPLWFLQSMATGPPRANSSRQKRNQWENQASC